MKTPILLVLLVTLLVPRLSMGADDKPAAPQAAVKRVEVQEYDKMRLNTNAVILDVRSAPEFEKGHVPGAINIDVNSPRFTELTAKLDKSKPYLVNCAVGMRSAKACKKLEAAGFKELYDLAPGFDGWRKAHRQDQK